MGVKKLSKAYKNTKKIRDNFLLENEKEKADPNTTPILINPKVNNKRLGVDFSVVLHKALGNDVSAAEFQVLPNIPITKVTEICAKLTNLARRSNVTLVVCPDGLYHLFKSSANEDRAKTRLKAQQRLDVLFQSKDPTEKMAEMKKLMKKTVFVREEILMQALIEFRRNKIELYSGPYESDFQLAFWEKTDFTDGTISVDSDIFAL